MNKLKIEDRLAIMWTLIDSQGYSVLKNPEFFVIAIVDFFLQKKILKFSIIWGHFYLEILQKEKTDD